jgi:hypothetical protein
MMTPSQYLEIVKQQSAIIAEAELLIQDAEAQAAECPLPDNLRPATPADIVEDVIVWYPRWTGRRWAIVDEVLDPTDKFKAFLSDYERCGLDGAFVEVVE